MNTAYTTEYTYDNKDYLHLGKAYLTSVKDPEGNITTYKYAKEAASDGYRKLVIKTDAENKITKTQWTKLGYLAFIIDPAGKKTYYSPDYLGRPKTIVTVQRLEVLRRECHCERFLRSNPLWDCCEIVQFHDVKHFYFSSEI